PDLASGAGNPSDAAHGKRTYRLVECRVSGGLRRRWAYGPGGRKLGTQYQIRIAPRATLGAILWRFSRRRLRATNRGALGGRTPKSGSRTGIGKPGGPPALAARPLLHPSSLQCCVN